MRIPTVRVRCDYSPDGFKVINESEVNDFHELWPDQEDASREGAPKQLLLGEVVTVQGMIGKGVVTLSTGGVVTIEFAPVIQTHGGLPDDWRDLHWKRQIKLAKERGLEGEPTPAEAKAFLEARAA